MSKELPPTTVSRPGLGEPLAHSLVTMAELESELFQANPPHPAEFEDRERNRCMEHSW